jgi:hypothetical protein
MDYFDAVMIVLAVATCLVMVVGPALLIFWGIRDYRRNYDTEMLWIGGICGFFIYIPMILGAVIVWLTN